MEISYAGIVGALMGLAIGYIDYRVIAGILRGRRELNKDSFVARLTDGQFNGLLGVLFVSTVALFPIVGYLMGKSVGG